LISALGQLADFRKAVTMDFKQAGNLVYLIGTTKAELGGSHYTLVNNLTGGEAPRVDLELAPKIFRAVHQAITAKLLRACHDLSEGGLAAAAAEMCFGRSSRHRARHPRTAAADRSQRIPPSLSSPRATRDSSSKWSRAIAPLSKRSSKICR
jgi:phosphoribosylformylglycinamidine (FGAM) synthase-like enzyme